MNKILCINAIGWIFSKNNIGSMKEYCVYNNDKGLYLECPKKIKSHVINTLAKVKLIIPTKEMTLQSYNLLI